LPSRTEGNISLPDGINSGILIVHNEAGDSRITNITLKAGKFQGMIVGDYMLHFHIDVLGSVMLLSPDTEEEANCNGNLDHKIFYSSQAVTFATSVVLKFVGAQALYGFGKKRLAVKHVYE
jgi:hypothetical protein